MHKQLLTSVATLGLCLHAQSADIVRDSLLELPSGPIGAMQVAEGAVNVGRKLFSDTRLIATRRLIARPVTTHVQNFLTLFPLVQGPLMIRLHL
jgi:hypothetical protein